MRPQIEVSSAGRSGEDCKGRERRGWAMEMGICCVAGGGVVGVWENEGYVWSSVLQATIHFYLLVGGG